MLSGCSGFLDITPKNKQTQEQLFSTKGGFYIAINGIYNGIASEDLYGRKLTYEMLDILAKRYTVNNSSLYFRDLAQYGYSSSYVSPVVSKVWENAYSLILACNILIDNTEKQVGILSKNESDIFKGESYAVRAFLHFDLLRLFGPRWANNPTTVSIPYNEAGSVQVLQNLPIKDVIDKIINDLKKAETLLANDPIIINGPMASEKDGESIQLRYRQFRFNYYSVKALLARVYLYVGDKSNALTKAKELLTDPKISEYFPPVDPSKLLANYTNPDRVFSSEILTGIYLKSREEAFSRYFSLETAGLTFLQPYTAYIGNYLFTNETQDYRFQSQWETASGVGASGHVFLKYKPIKQPDPNDADSEYFYSKMISLVRLSEVYYIAAECEPVAVEGLKWLNEMRKRRGLPAVSGSITSPLIKEYIREFYGEGQSFYLFKRLAINQAYENGQALAYALYTDDAYRLPLPEGELK